MGYFFSPPPPTSPPHRNPNLDRCPEPKPRAEGEEATAVATKSSDADVNGSGSVTYELFLKEASEARRLFSKGGRLGESIPGVEARIAALEKALGGGDGGAKGAGGVFGEGGEVSRGFAGRCCLGHRGFRVGFRF